MHDLLTIRGSHYADVAAAAARGREKERERETEREREREREQPFRELRQHVYRSDELHQITSL